jgi:hypothetical protein
MPTAWHSPRVAMSLQRNSYQVNEPTGQRCLGRRRDQRQCGKIGGGRPRMSRFNEQLTPTSPCISTPCCVLARRQCLEDINSTSQLKPGGSSSGAARRLSDCMVCSQEPSLDRLRAVSYGLALDVNCFVVTGRGGKVEVRSNFATATSLATFIDL